METTSAKTNHLRAPHGTFALAASARAHWVHWEDKLHVIIILVQSEFNEKSRPNGSGAGGSYFILIVILVESAVQYDSAE